MAAIAIRAKVIVISALVGAIWMEIGRWEVSVPFGASVMPAVWSSSSLVFKLFPKEASLPGGGRGGGENREWR